MTFSRLTPWLALLALIVLVASCQHSRALRTQLDRATDDARRANHDAQASAAVIERLLADAKDKDAQRAQLDRARAGVDATLATYRNELRRLIDENAAVRAWAAGALPDDVVRLHASPALNGADDYAQRMRGGDALHNASDETTNQR
ncbi:phage lysis regulatory, LysB family protein [Burkholderia pseudomallei 7894]|nr:phage lysis regulatory, LysB family protein [Burkholderia pseudomallei 7894]ARK66785.1 protein LYSB [Burkholderia pseudomallei]OMQ78231.1 protein LYSB [Burkholderia pseudomallei]